MDHKIPARRFKREPGLKDDDDEEEEEQTAQHGPSAKRIKKSDDHGRLVPITVEFMFCSCKTKLLDQGEMTGTLHVPMLQDPDTGRFQIPAGTTEAKGKAKFSYRDVEDSFTATFERPSASAPIENFRLGYDLTSRQDDGGFHPGFVNAKDEYDGNCHSESEFETYPVKINEEDIDREHYRERLNSWQANAGGMLAVYAEGVIDDEFLEYDEEQRDVYYDTIWKANYKVKLYTTLSAHSPDETSLKVEEDSVPQWGRLEQLMMKRFPQNETEWHKRAVKNYIYFLDMKKEHADWNSELFSPSKWVDEVWHAHLSFTDRYQQDMLAFCGHIIEHSPVLGARALRQYHAAYDKYVAKMEQLDEIVDSVFWPAPKREEEHFDSQQQNDGDSEDGCYLTGCASCG